MGLLDCDLLVIVGGGGGVGRAKILATCISCNVKAIFTGFVGGEVSVLHSTQILSSSVFSSQASVAWGKRSDARMALVSIVTNMSSEIGSFT